MKFLLNLLLFLSFSYAVSEEYISEFQANVKMIKEYNISEIEKFRSYQLTLYL